MLITRPVVIGKIIFDACDSGFPGLLSFIITQL